MSMSELEARCVDAAHNTRGPIDGYMLAVVRAVLAEAGVADLRQTIAEAYQAGAEDVHEAWMEAGGHMPGDADFWEAALDYADSAKIGANQ